MAKFRLLAGQYVDENKRLFKRGDVVETELDLDRMFRSAFERINDPTVLATPSAEEAPGVTAPKVPMSKEAPKPPVAKPQDKSKAAEPSTPLVEKDKTTHGREVTKSFPKALEEDFRVFKQGAVYFVYDVDDMSKPLNDPGIEKRAEVNKFITAYLKRKG